MTLQSREGHPLQGDGVCRVVGDYDIRPDLLGMAQHGCGIGELGVVELDDIVAGAPRLEVGHNVLAELGAEHECVTVSPAGELVIASAAVEAIISVIPDQRIRKLRANDVLDATDYVALRTPSEACDGLQQDAKIDVHAS